MSEEPFDQYWEFEDAFAEDGDALFFENGKAKKATPAKCVAPWGGNYGPPTPVCRGTAPYFEWVQASLNKVQSTTLTVNGDNTKATKAAVKAFQTAKNLSVDGSVGAGTEAALLAAGADPVPMIPQVTSIGIDHNIDLTTYVSCLSQTTHKSIPLGFVVRYYAYKIYSKIIKPSEAQALTAAGIKIVAVWETRSFTSKDFLGSFAKKSNPYYALGDDHGHTACIRGKEMGQPSNTPIYFAVDNCDVGSGKDDAKKQDVIDYFNGVAAGLQRGFTDYGLRYYCGVYGRWTALDLCRDQKLATWFWQSCSTGTSGGKMKWLWPGANMRQYPHCNWKDPKKTCNWKGNYPDLDESYGNEGGWLSTLPAASTSTTTTTKKTKEFEDESELDYLFGNLVVPKIDRTTHDYIAWTQHWLRASGIAVGVDGGMGNKTHAAIRKFQRAHNLTESGNVDDPTEAALIAVGNENPPTIVVPAAVGFDTNVPLTDAQLTCIEGETYEEKHLEFVVRYYSPVGNSKNLTKAEAMRIAHKGMRLVSVWERYGNATEMTYAQGVDHAKKAYAMAQSCGQPTETPIYFAFDADPVTGDKAKILDYFKGVKDGMSAAATAKGTGEYTIGIYGPGAVLTWCRDQGIATFFWQCVGRGMQGNYMLWSGAHLRQVTTPKGLCSTNVDYDEAYATDYGGWWPMDLLWELIQIPFFEMEGPELEGEGFRARRRQRLGYEAGPCRCGE